MIPNLCWHTVPTYGSKRNMWYGVNTFRLWSWLSRCRWCGRLGIFTCISKGKKRKKQKGFFICNCIGFKHDTKLVLTYSPYTWFQKEYVKWRKYLPFVKLAAPMSLTRTTGRFQLHFKREKKEEKGFFISNCNGLKHDTKLVLTYSPYIWLQKGLCDMV